MELLEVDDSLVLKAIGSRRIGYREGQNGRVAVVGGSWMCHGAPVLASLAAYRTGVELVYLAVPRLIAPSVRALSPNVMVIPLPDAKLTIGCAKRLLKWLPKVDSLAVGVGMRRQRTGGMGLLVREVLDKGIKVLADGEAIPPEAIRHLGGKSSVLVTSESDFERLFEIELGEGLLKRIDVVRRVAEEHSLTVLLRGRVDVVSDGRKVALNRTRDSGMTVWGTRSVLSGVVVAMLSKAEDPFLAASSASYVSSLAGDLAYKKYGPHILATDLVEELPEVLRRFDWIVDT